jgi:hypothetical protein
VTASLPSENLSTDVYREASLGFGAEAHNWRDKPHRLIYDLCDEIDALRDSLVALVVAAGRMLDGWAEGDDAVKGSLWRALHQAAEDADERHHIYPLRTSEEVGRG